MKSRVVFKSNFSKLASICIPVAILEEAFFAYFAFATDVIIEENRTLVFIVFSCAMFIAILGMLWLLFRQYLVVNDETVTYCKWFKREQTINWKDATVNETVSVQSALPTAVISDGTQSISLSTISVKNMALLKELCNTARERYNADNLTF